MGLESKSGATPKKIGQYEVEGKLGRGGMGTVYRALDGPLGRRVALKVLSEELAQDVECRQRFLKEGAAAASDQSHPRIVAIHNLIEEEEVIAIAMELVDGPSLEELVKGEGPLEERVALDYLLQTVDALESKAERGIIHRDVKPANLLVDRKRGVKLTDFGLSRCLTEASRLTQPDMVMGSPSYMSPEQAQGLPDLDHRSDIYSLGATLHYMLTGKPPFNAPNSTAMALAHLKEPPPDLTRTHPKVSKRTARLVAKMLAKKPEERPQAYSEITREAEACLADARALSKGSGQTPAPVEEKTKIAAKAPEADAGGTASPSPSRPTPTPPPHAPPPLERLRRRGKVKAGVAAALALAYLIAFTGQRGMVWVPAGVYALDHPSKARKLHVDSGFWIDRYEVTNAQYKEFQPKHEIPRGEEQHPVVNLKEDAARGYAEWAGKRLPTDAEWEVAARGPQPSVYPWGNDKSTGAGNLKDASEKGPRPVGSYRSDRSGFGCYDMAGNVREFTHDGTRANIVGGSFREDQDADLLVPPGHYYHYLDEVGFRCVKDPGALGWLWWWIKLALLLAAIAAVAWLL